VRACSELPLLLHAVIVVWGCVSFVCAVPAGGQRVLRLWLPCNSSGVTPQAVV